jgi:hypothetical protein
MKKHIVITSIFSPTEAVEEFSRMRDYNLIVVGDKKSPPDWSYENVEYLSIDNQEGLNFNLAKALPYNHYCRKMIGYLQAIKEGAEYIIDTDDDNIPKENWSFPGLEGEFDTIPEKRGFVNVYQLFSKEKIWPRGLPLNLISKQFELEQDLKKGNCKIGIWQGLADEDPDVDAVYRLVIDKQCVFDSRSPVVLSKGTISPFNTQNTMIRKELFALMYLPTFVTFRFTDILRGLVAQSIMWLYDYRLGFTEATVIQKRNPHDYMKDFISEIPMYKSCDRIIEIVSEVISSSKSIEDNIFSAYEALRREDIVCDEELETLKLWLSDLS